MNSNPFLEHFIKDVENPEIGSAILEYASVKSSKSFVGFVEGFLDRKIFKIKSPGILNIDVTKLHIIVCGCKKNVTKLPTHIKEKYEKDKEKPKCFFIVDHDYDGASAITFGIVSVLPCYSIENYFFKKNNLLCILNYFEFNDENKSLFQESFKKFINDILCYETLLKLKVLKYHEIGMNEIKKILECGEFNGKCFSIDKEFDNMCLKIYNSFIKKDIKYKSIYEKYYEELSNNLEMIRGHDFELFMNSFINYFWDIKDFIKQIPKYNKLINNIEISFKIKLGIL